MKRPTVLWTLAALLGLALAAGFTWATSQVVSQHIGLSAEPLSAARGLAPRASPAAPRRPRAAPAAAKPPASTTPATPVANRPAPAATPSPPAPAPDRTTPGPARTTPAATRRSDGAEGAATRGAASTPPSSGAGDGGLTRTRDD